MLRKPPRCCIGISHRRACLQLPIPAFKKSSTLRCSTRRAARLAALLIGEQPGVPLPGIVQRGVGLVGTSVRDARAPQP